MLQHHTNVPPVDEALVLSNEKWESYKGGKATTLESNYLREKKKIHHVLIDNLSVHSFIGILKLFSSAEVQIRLPTHTYNRHESNRSKVYLNPT